MLCYFPSHLKRGIENFFYKRRDSRNIWQNASKMSPVVATTRNSSRTLRRRGNEQSRGSDHAQ